jgi:threonine dehydrogenase-like Zn-dependent dehydrogenase
MYLKRMGVKTVYAITAGDNLKREELAVNLGADKVFNLTREGTNEITKKLQAENGGLGVDLCFEASGAPQAVVQGLDILRNRGGNALTNPLCIRTIIGGTHLHNRWCNVGILLYRQVKD